MRERAIFFILAAIGFIWQALTTHISASEFWPIKLSKEVWHSHSPETGLYFKPSFHLLLSFLYLLPLDSVAHVLAARVVFALLAAGTIFLFIAWLRELDLLSRRSFFLACLLFSPLLISQIVKVRSDMMSLFLSVLILYLVSKKPRRWSSRRFVSIAFLNLALLGSTPRAIFHFLVILAFTVPFYWRQLKIKKSREHFLIAFGMPLLTFFLIFIPYAGVFSLHLSNYLANSYENATNWYSVVAWMKSEPFLFLFDLAALIFCLFKFRNLRRGQLLIPFFAAVFSVAAADLKTPYLIASFFPFFILPIILVVNEIKSSKLIMASSLCLIVSNVFIPPSLDWGGTNTAQIEVMRKVSKLLVQNPSYVYFDGLGILPRANQILSYLGPYDDISLDATWAKLQANPPHVVLYTGRGELLGTKYIDFLYSRYNQTAANLFVRKDLDGGKDIEFSKFPVLIFGLSPYQ